MITIIALFLESKKNLFCLIFINHTYDLKSSNRFVTARHSAIVVNELTIKENAS